MLKAVCLFHQHGQFSGRGVGKVLGVEIATPKEASGTWRTVLDAKSQTLPPWPIQQSGCVVGHDRVDGGFAEQAAIWPEAAIQMHL